MIGNGLSNFFPSSFLKFFIKKTMDCLKERLLFDIDLYTKAMIRQYNSFFRPNDRPLYSSDLDVGFQIVSSNNKCGEVKIPSNHRFGSPLVSNSDYRVIPCFKMGNGQNSGDFFPHFFIERFQAGDTV